jgi:hypothetical protein
MKYLDPFPFGFLSESLLIFFVFGHDLLESGPFLLLAIQLLLLLNGQLLFNFLHQQVIQFVILLLLKFFTLVLVLHLLVSHLLLQLNLSLVLLLLLFFPLVIEFALFGLQLVVFAFFHSFAFLSPFLFFQLLVKLLLDLFLEFLLSHSLQLLLFLEEFSVELHQSGPLILVISFNLVD